MTSFLAVTFALTWTAWWTCARWGSSHALFALGGPVFMVGVFGPGLAALALTAHREGRRGARLLLAPIGAWEQPVGLYLFPLAFTPATKLVAATVHRLLAGTWPAFSDTPVPLMLGAIVVSTWVQAGEEVGWRGYLLPRLAARVGLGAATLVVGVVWAVWHLPLFRIAGTGSDGQSFVVYLLWVVALSVAMGWLYWQSGGSVLMVMVMHAAVNNLMGLVPGGLADPVSMFSLQASVVTWATVAASWAVALVLLARMMGQVRP